jgi:hypothetical protein
MTCLNPRWTILVLHHFSCIIKYNIKTLNGRVYCTVSDHIIFMFFTNYHGNVDLLSSIPVVSSWGLLILVLGNMHECTFLFQPSTNTPHYSAGKKQNSATCGSQRPALRNPTCSSLVCQRCCRWILQWSS